MSGGAAAVATIEVAASPPADLLAELGALPNVLAVSATDLENPDG